MYLFVAYKADSTEYSLGCRVGSYSSDFILVNNLDEDGLVREWAKVLHANMNLGHYELDFSVYVFQNGQQVYPDWDGPVYPERDGGYFGDFDYEGIARLERLSNLQAAALRDEALRLSAEQEKAKLQAAHEADKANRLRQWEELSKEFGGTKNV